MELQLVWYGLKRKSMLFVLFYLSGVYHLYIIMVCSFVFSFLFFSFISCCVSSLSLSLSSFSSGAVSAMASVGSLFWGLSP